MTNERVHTTGASALVTGCILYIIPNIVLNTMLTDRVVLLCQNTSKFGFDIVRATFESSATCEKHLLQQI